jgi:hypothetical protein
VKPGWLVVVALLTACGDGTTWLGEQIADGAVRSPNGGVADAGAPAALFMRYEAESPVNTLAFPVQQIESDGYATCPAGDLKEGADCASSGRVVSQILGRSPCEPPTSQGSYDGCQNIGGGITFNDVTVPADGTYDVTWWYHCGADPAKPGRANVYGDTGCGGLDYQTGTGSGCRSHLIDVNGVPMSSTVSGERASFFHFPCYGSAWSILHGAITALPLKAGANAIYIHAPGARTLDAVDIDALDIQPSGRGAAEPPQWPKLVTPVVAGN